MLQNASGAEPKRVLRVGRFRRRLVGSEPNLRAAVVCGRMIELYPRTRRDVGVLAFHKAVSGLMPGAVPLHHGPPKTACAHVLAVGRKVFVLEAREGSVFLEETLVDVRIVVVVEVPDGHLGPCIVRRVEEKSSVPIAHPLMAAIEQSLCHRNGLPSVIARLAWRVHHLEPLLRASFAVAEHAVLLDPHG